MRRWLSLSLFVAMLLPLLLPMMSVAAEAQAGVPACCRRGGAHHCADGMGAMAMPAGGGARVRGPREMCPYQQRGLVAGAHYEQVGMSAGSMASMQVVLRGPGLLAQVECLRRISFDRSRQKRGPPVFFS